MLNSINILIFEFHEIFSIENVDRVVQYTFMLYINIDQCCTNKHVFMSS